MYVASFHIFQYYTSQNNEKDQKVHWDMNIYTVRKFQRINNQSKMSDDINAAVPAEI